MPALAQRPRLPRPDDPEIVKLVTDAVARGHPLGTAGKLAGLGHDVAPGWVRDGLVIIAQHPDTDPRELGSHAAFAASVKDAEARFVDENLRYVNEARAPDAKGWLPAMTLLERRRPQDFGRRDRQDVHVEQRSVSINITAQLGSEALRGLAQLLNQQAEELSPAELSASTNLLPQSTDEEP